MEIEWIIVQNWRTADFKQSFIPIRFDLNCSPDYNGETLESKLGDDRIAVYVSPLREAGTILLLDRQGLVQSKVSVPHNLYIDDNSYVVTDTNIIVQYKKNAETNILDNTGQLIDKLRDLEGKWNSR